MTIRVNHDLILYSEDLRDNTFTDKGGRIPPFMDPTDHGKAGNVANPAYTEAILTDAKAIVASVKTILGANLTDYSVKIRPTVGGTVESPSYALDVCILRTDAAKVTPRLSWVILTQENGAASLGSAFASLKARLESQASGKMAIPPESKEYQEAKASLAKIEAKVKALADENATLPEADRMDLTVFEPQVKARRDRAASLAPKMPPMVIVWYARHLLAKSPEQVKAEADAKAELAKAGAK